MADFPGFIENDDNVEGTQQDENVILYSHWQRICAVVIASVSVAAWFQLTVAAVVSNSQTKKFDAEDDVWEALIKDNPASASLRHQFESMSSDVPMQSTNNQNSSVNCAGSSAENLPTETSDQAMPDTSGSQPFADSGKMKKRKATADMILQSVGKNITSSLDNLSRAIIESAEILANKTSRPYDRSDELLTSLQALELSQEYLVECYDFLTKHEAAANKCLGIPHEFRKELLTRIMISASLSK